MEREQYGKKSINSPVQFEDDSTENSLDDNFEKCSDDNFEMKVVPEKKKLCHQRSVLNRTELNHMSGNPV